MDSSRNHNSEFDSLFGEHPRRGGHNRPSPGSAMSLTQLPEALRIETEGHLPIPDFEKAVDISKAQDDMQTVFFINFIQSPEDGPSREQRVLMDSIQAWQAWALTTCEAKVQQQVDIQMLPRGEKGQFARGTYRAKVFDNFLHSATCFTKTAEENMSKHIQAKRLDIHSNLMSSVLDSFNVPNRTFSVLERVLSKIVDGILISNQRASTEVQYWIMMAKYDHQPMAQTIQPSIRAVQFQAGPEACQFVTGKRFIESISCDLNFREFRGGFNNSAFSTMRPEMEQRRIDLGKELVRNWTLDVNIQRY